MRRILLRPPRGRIALNHIVQARGTGCAQLRDYVLRVCSETKPLIDEKYLSGGDDERCTATLIAPCRLPV